MTALIGFILVFILLFLLLREFNCWYFKFNEMLSVQKEILLQLKKQNNDLVDMDNSTNSEEYSNSEKSYIEHITEE